MNSSYKQTGAALAMAAAGLFLSAGAPAVFAQDAKLIHCEGVNACKGNNDCKTAKNDCKGHGSCKGQGFVALTAAQCAKVGGKVGK